MTAQRIQLGTVSPVREAPRPATRRHNVHTGYDLRVVMVLAFAANVLGIGWTGVFMPDRGPADLMGDGREMRDDAPPMMEVALREELPTPSASAALPAEIPPVEAVETPPEPVPAMTFEDVFEVPAPPEMIRPLDVERVKPEAPATSGTANTTPPGGQRRPSARVPAGPPAASAPSQGAQGKKAKTPQPPYPAFARLGKMTGTVVVSLLVDATGSVTSATVARSSGHPALDSYTCNYIRRSWRWPEGSRRTFNQPVSFRLR